MLGLAANWMVSPEDVEWASRFYWHVLKNGYIVRNVKVSDGKWTTQYLHREVAGRSGLDLSSRRFVDHINRDKLDNRRENLRSVSSAQSTYNKGVRSDNKIGVLGVCYDAKRHRFKAAVQVAGRTVWQKRFDTLEEAISAREFYAREHFGEFAPC